jgi:hypothetical protein
MARHSLLPWGAGPSFWVPGDLFGDRAFVCGFVTQLSSGAQIAYELSVTNLIRIEWNDETVSFVSDAVLRMTTGVLVGTRWGGVSAWQ